MIYQAKDLLVMSKDELWRIFNTRQKMTVQMEDGPVKASGRSTIFSVYCWEIAKIAPIPLLIKHHLADRQFNTSTMQDLINEVLWTFKDLYKDQYDRELLEAAIGHAVNAIYNDFTYRLESHVKSLEITDFIEIVQDEKVSQINQALKPNYQSIENAHKQITKLLKDKERFKGNPVGLGCRTGVLKIGQVLQCVSARGYLTDIDNNIFRYPILKGYVHGFRKLYELAIDSRSASKSLDFTEIPLQSSQYFNRRLQIITDTVSDLIPGDCGSTTYLEWFIHPQDVASFDGKYYVDDANQLKRFDAKTAAAEGLVNRTVKFRSVLHCQSKHPRGVCETCFGELRHSIVAGTNIGHVACTKLGERISQIILSTKHLDRSASANSLELSQDHQRFLRNMEGRAALAIAEELDPKKTVITLDSNEAARLADVLYVDDVSVLQTSLISQLTRVQFNVKTRKEEISEIVPISAGKRMASMSKELLEYAKTHGWTLTSNNNYSIDLRHWRKEDPLFTLPLKNANMLDYMRTIEAFLTGAKNNLVTRSIRECKTVHEALKELYEIVSTQLQINIAYLEIMVFAFMIRSSMHLDFRLPLAGNTVQFGKISTIVAGRSASAILAYEHQKTILKTPQTYLIKYRPNHPLDTVVVS